MRWEKIIPDFSPHPANLSCMHAVVARHPHRRRRRRRRVTQFPKWLLTLLEWKRERRRRCLLSPSLSLSLCADFSAKLSSNKCVVKASPSQRFSLACVCTNYMLNRCAERGHFSNSRPDNMFLSFELISATQKQVAFPFGNLACIAGNCWWSIFVTESEEKPW